MTREKNKMQVKEIAWKINFQNHSYIKIWLIYCFLNDGSQNTSSITLNLMGLLS